MPIITTSQLSREQQDAVLHLTELCRQADSLTLSCPEDGDSYWLFMDEDGDLLSFLAAYEIAQDVWECYGFTRPDLRGQGYFSALLSEACGDGGALADGDLYFVCDGACKEALKVLEHMGAELSSEEYMMEWDWEKEKELPQEVLKQAGPCPLSLLLPDGSLLSEGGPDTGSALMVRAFTPDSRLAAFCHLSFQGDDVYLYGLEVLPDMRRKGVGTAFLCILLCILRDRGYGRLRLQVSRGNEGAMALYQKTGFRITETLSYYLY